MVPKKDPELKDKLYDAAVEMLIDSGVDVSLKIVKKEDFNRLLKLSAPFIENVMREGIKVG